MDASQLDSAPRHHLAVHELGYTVRALGRGRFAWHQPDGTRILEAPRLNADTLPLSAAPSEPMQPRRSGQPDDQDHGDQPDQPDQPERRHRLQPTWGGEHLDLDHLLTGWAGNLINDSGRRLGDIPAGQLDQALRDAAGFIAAA